MGVFEVAVESIRDGYERLGHSLGWRFLYSPAASLDCPRLMFAGFNPGGSVFETPLGSVEAGNAFRVERWPGNGPNHQARVVRLLADIGRVVVPGVPAADFIDDTLTTNFCPFRSPSVAALHRKAESVAFSENLWASIFDAALPSVIIGNGVDTAHRFAGPLRSAGYVECQSERFRTGWGDTTYQVTGLSRHGERVTVFGIPHMSRFDIKGRTEREGLIGQIALALGNK